MLVEDLQIDITTYCNSHCGGCIRNNSGGEACVELVHLSPEIFEKINFDDIKVVYFNGAYGDFTMHPNIFTIFRSIPKRMVFDASTNGGARKPEWWSQLANQIKRFRTSRITFAIDGVDTNHLYRRGVDIHKVLSHAQSFIDSGGNARWRYIAFEHNQHEIEKASNLAKDMGFSEFVVGESYVPEIYQKKYSTFNEMTVKRVVAPTKHNWRKDKARIYRHLEDVDLGFRCTWRNQGRAQLDAWGNIWQCCYMPSIATHPEMYKELTLFELDNNLNKYGYDEILQGSFFSELFDAPIDLCKNCKDYV
jgi:MoaA/NifB/PqqE/SkfB family radical SAM enzyme